MLMVVTVVSVALALVMSVVAWRASAAERQRSAARIAVLAREIHGDDVELTQPAMDLDLGRPEPAAVAATPGLFATATAPAESGSRWGVALAAGAFVVASIAAAVIVFGGESPSAAIAEPRVQTAPAQEAAHPAAVPLELVALRYERDGNQLTIRGVVRNPASGTPMERLTAVVFLFDRDGGFLTSGRAAVASPSLIPGGESTFVVTIPSAGDVGRYRVSFRSDERVVAHVDKRSIS